MTATPVLPSGFSKLRFSKDAISRLAGRLKADFETWRCRDPSDDRVQYLVMDRW